MNYCIAIFDDDELDLAIGRAGVNVNLASNVTNYKIDAFGKKEYERKQIEQETKLKSIDNVNKTIVALLSENEINTVSDLLNSSENSLLDIDEIDESALEEIYDSVQKFIEKNQEEESSPEEAVEEESSPEEAVEEESSPEEAVEEESSPEEAVEEESSPEEAVEEESSPEEAVEEESSPEEAVEEESSPEEAVEEESSPEEAVEEESSPEEAVEEESSPEETKESASS